MVLELPVLLLPAGRFVAPEGGLVGKTATFVGCLTARGADPLSLVPRFRGGAAGETDVGPRLRRSANNEEARKSCRHRSSLWGGSR